MGGIPHPEGAPNFKFANAEGDAPKSIKRIDALETFIVEYIDGAGKEQVRIAFRVPDSQQVIVLQERISGTNVATMAHPWFNKAIQEKMEPEEGAPSI